MATPAIPKPKTGTARALYISTEGNIDASGPYSWYHVRAKMCTVHLSNTDPYRDTCWPDGHRRSGISYGNFGSPWPGQDALLAHLEVNSQGSGDDRPRRLYSREFRYRDIYSMDLSEIEYGARFLRAVRKRMEAERASLGRPASFSAYVGAFARAVGAKYILIPETADCSTSGCTHRTYSIGDGIEQVEWIDRQWVEAGSATVSAE